jgi:hypothetical protein
VFILNFNQTIIHFLLKYLFLVIYLLQFLPKYITCNDILLFISRRKKTFKVFKFTFRMIGANIKF